MDRDPSLLFESLAEQFAQQLRTGSPPDIEHYAREHPQLAQRIRSLFPVLQMMEQQQLSEIIDESGLLDEELKLLNEVSSVDASELSQNDISEDPVLDSVSQAEVEFYDLPPQIGRYRIDKVLGKGSFGVVYLAHDLQLNRQVAVKVPHPVLIANSEDAEAYLAEARTVASLDHPGIVPVYDIGSTDDHPCFVVSKYIEGMDLATKLKQRKQRRLKYRQAAELIATVAEALHYAHKQGIVHRDIKPSNILIGTDGQPYVVDFGLALREENIGRGPKFAGTPMYMSPEQARGEGHRVDGRSDIFSLGVVLYELLTGRRPFRGETRAELLKQVTSYEARPLRQYDDNLPQELERICHKAIAKRASERYFIAKDLAEDLRLFLQAETVAINSKSTDRKAVEGDGWSVEGSESGLPLSQHSSRTTLLPSPSTRPDSSDSPPFRIVPKGLRSFDAHDADFFLELLPGPRDRDGLPDSLRFWKTRIEETDADNTFSVGLIYGPSGCGKSSLMKAGLLPQLSESVIPIYIEATGEETETRLLRNLRKRCSQLDDHFNFDDNPSLSQILAALRRGQGIPDGTKVLIVLDQFEQWLNAKKEELNPELVQALRQCDGGRLQCIVMVRDDFWLAVSRFLRELEVRLVEGQNSALVDLFDRDHARKVLAAFGRAFGRLPENIRETSIEQKTFLQQAATGLAEEGKVICVRLALFAEMMKGKVWTPATLKEVGGTTGIGVTFLDETFSASTSPPEHRYHQQAARAVLKELLPNSGTDIKGAMRSHNELLQASGYDNRPRDFEDLVRILDSEVRLITPTERVEGDWWRVEGPGSLNGEIDESSKLSTAGGLATGDGFGVGDARDAQPAGGNVTTGATSASTEQDGSHQPQAQRPPQSPPQNTLASHHPPPTSLHPLPSTRHFQLTHDYLVPSLRDWLTRKQKETRKGRAELKLSNSTQTWNSKPENRFLPSWWDHLTIRLLTDKRKWTETQRKMMSHSGRVHGLRSSIVLLVLVALISLGGMVRNQVAKQQQTTRIEGLVAQLLTADPNQIPDIVRQLDASPGVAEKFLAPLLIAPTETPDQRRTRLHAQLASVSRNPSLVESLKEELLTCRVPYIAPLRELLKPYSGRLKSEFVDLLQDETATKERRFAAALALADYLSKVEIEALTESELTFVALQLVSSNAEFQPTLRELLRPIQRRLLPDLERVFQDPLATDAQRLSAANAFVDYADGDVSRLAQLLTVATPEQFAVIFPLVVADFTPAVLDNLIQITATLPPADMGSVERIGYGQRRANAAVTLLRLGEPEKVPAVFEWSDDPEALTQFIFRCQPRGIEIETLLNLFEMVVAMPADKCPKDARYALMLAIGEYAPSEIPASRRAALIDQLADWYANDPSSGVHGAAGWLLRHLGEHEMVTRVDQTPVPYASDREWFNLAITVTPTQPAKPENIGADEEQGQPVESEIIPRPNQTFYYTFIVFPPGEYIIGSPEDEPDRSTLAIREMNHTVKLTRPFALLDREITMEELIAFSPKYEGFRQQFNTRRQDAGHAVHWYDSVAFCRWLGEQMDLPESSQPYTSPEGLDEEKYRRDPDPEAKGAPRDWPLDLDRLGFRLPTEAEWEIVSRGGARTAHGFGGDVVLRERFGWSVENSGKQVHSTKELRPSIRGLFDLGGNVFEYTHNWYSDYGMDGVVDPLGPDEGVSRVIRGGGFFNAGGFFRSASRDTVSPTYRSLDLGFRLALTCGE